MTKKAHKNRIGPWLAKKEIMEQMGVDQKDMIVFDVGARIGDVTAMYKRMWPDAWYFCFEPEESALADLRDRFGDDPKVTIIPCAVTNRLGTGTLFVGGHNTEMSSLLPRPRDGRRYFRHNLDKGKVKVQLTTLNAFATENGIEHVHVLKADIQGGEYKMLQGASNLTFDLMYLEVLFVEMYRGCKTFWEISRYLDRSGYTLFDLYAIGRSFVNRQIKYADALFVSSLVRESVLNKYPDEWLPKSRDEAMGE